MAGKSGSGVATIRKELSDTLAKYRIIEDALAGEAAVKAAKETYLPVPQEATDCEAYKVARYNAYLTRAVYYNMIKPTQEALVGQLFLRPPKVSLPEAMAGMETDINGEGLNLEQLTRMAANHVLPYGRCGFLTDFPETGGNVTQKDIEDGVQPIIRFFSPWSIINWRVEKRGTKQKLVLLVLKEVIEEYDEATPFVAKLVNRYRVYKLSEVGEVSVEVWADDESAPIETFELLDSEGNPWKEIPFEFIGSENNDVEIDDPPLYSMATLNIAHYRNSADYEESCFLVGQPTPVYSGLTEDWMENYFKNGVPFGSRASVPLPVGAQADLLQASPNTLAFEAMTHKEHQMVAIGAKLINPKNTVERKEAEIQIEAASQRSVLTTIKDNLQNGLIAALKRAALFVGANDTEIDLELNDNFDLTSMSAEELRWLIELHNNNLIEFEAVHENLRRSGIVKNTAEESKALILANLEFRTTMASIEQAANPEPTNPTNKE